MPILLPLLFVVSCLLTAAGHFLQAAEAGPNAVQAKELLGRIRPVNIDDVGNRTFSDLEMRIGALLREKDAGAESTVNHSGMVQDTLKICADNPSMWSPVPSQRALCWLVVDQMLRNLKPQAIMPLRDLQERSGRSLIRQLSPSSDEQEITRIFQRYPWAASMHELLVEFGETSLREGKFNQAQRAFQNALTYSTDPVVVAQAHVGLWLAMDSASVTRETLAESMAAVPDDTLLPWRGNPVSAVEVKRAILAQDPAGAASIPALANLRRLKLRLPVSLAMDEPVPLGRFPAPPGLGPWPICRVESDGDLLFVMGTEHVACYNANDLSLRWVQTGNPSLDSRLRNLLATDVASWPEPAWRPVSMGTAWSRAVMDCTKTQNNATTSPRMLYSLLRYNLRQGLLADVTALDALTGRVLWHTRDQAEWASLEPMIEPAAADGFVYVVACNAGGGPACQIHLVCLDGVTGKMIWKRLLGTAAVEGELRELARPGSAVTIFQESVYVSTSVGLIARCNARDGMVEWVQTYASEIQNARLSDQFRREGTSPLVTADWVIVAPRDHGGVLALSRVTGSLLWETVLVPSEQIIGIVGAKLLLCGRDELAALDVVTGKRLWSRNLGIEANGSRALIAGTDVVVVSREKLLRISAVTGKTREELRCTPSVGSDQLLLPNGALVEVSQDFASGPVAKMDSTIGTPQVPLTNDWTYACANALLVIPPANKGPKNTFGILAGRSFVCVTTQPRSGIAWQTLLRDGADSAGFHGKHVVIARGRTLTALDVASGAISWRYRLPFDPQIVAGDARVIVASDLTVDGKVSALDANTGELLWNRGFGKEMQFAGSQLGWISMRPNPADPSTVLLYWKSLLFGKEGPRPAEVEIDALTGTVREVRPFLGNESGWPARIAFGDHARTYTHKQPFFFPTHRLGFRRDEVALLSKENRIRFFPHGPGAELAPDWKRVLDLPQESQYTGALGLGVTAAGAYVKQLNNIFFHDATAKREVACKLPREAGEKAPVSLLELWETADTLTAVSAEPPPPPSSDSRLYTHGGLKDDTGKGDVTVKFFEGRGAAAQIYWPMRGIPEAGTTPVATFWEGTTVEAYYDQRMSMSGINSLGWTKYDVFLYGPTVWATINGKDRQTGTGFDVKNPLHRTAFIQGGNYVKFAGVTGDAFTLDYCMNLFSGIQIVDASAGTGPGRKAASLGVSWSGGPDGLGPNDRVGAEVAGGYWYVIRPDHQNDLYSKTHISGGYQNPYVYLDVFDRKAGTLIRTQKIPVAPRDHRLSGYDNQAAILDDVLVVADQLSVQVLRTTPRGPGLPSR